VIRKRKVIQKDGCGIVKYPFNLLHNRLAEQLFYKLVWKRIIIRIHTTYMEWLPYSLVKIYFHYFKNITNTNRWHNIEHNIKQKKQKANTWIYILHLILGLTLHNTKHSENTNIVKYKYIAYRIEAHSSFKLKRGNWSWFEKPAQNYRNVVG